MRRSLTERELTSMAANDIPAGDQLIKNSIALASSTFDRWASDNGYDIAPAVSPTDIRTYADRRTQEVFEAFSAGEASLARMLTDSTLDTKPMRERIRKLAEGE
jgi:hypothetical protein